MNRIPMRRESSPIHSSSSSTTEDLDVRSSASSSSRPSRILYFNSNSWVDFDRQVFDELSHGFVQNKPTFRLPINGKDCIFDFRQLLMTDLSAQTETSIAWIDGEGRCFFPKIVVGEKRSRFCGAAELLTSEEEYCKVVGTLFLNGMRRVVGSNVSITSIHKCLFLGKSGSLRLNKFKGMMATTKAIRGGDGNVSFGWYGAAVDDVARVVKHGFGKTNEGELRFHGEAHGVGVHLSASSFPFKSSLLCEPDECGQKHMVLCRVLVGNPEKLEAGSFQEHPSTDEFDSGVDDLTNPKWHIVWNTNMNTHILPEYIVTFKASSSPTPLRRGRARLIAQGLSFPRLLMEMGRSLPSSKMRELELLHCEFKGGKMRKDEFIRHVRSVAGDKLITSTIRRIRGY